jgi:hypothetical protein
LNLPEQADIATAQCSLCGATFDVPGPEAQQPHVPVVPAVPSHSGVTAEPPTPHARRSPEPDEDDPGGPLTAADRAALRSAVSWLKGAGVLVVLRTLLWGCFPVFMAAIAGVGEESWSAAACLVVYLGVCLFLGVEVETLNRLSSRPRAVIVCSLAAFATLVEVLLGLVAAWAILETARGGLPPDMLVVLVIALFQGALIVVFLVASIKAFAALRRPAVWHGFRTSPG